MKRYESKEIKQEVHVATDCDLCGKEVDLVEKGLKGRDHYAFYEADWIKYEEGTRYPDSGSSDVTEADICPACMKDKVIPALKAIGVKFQEREREW